MNNLSTLTRFHITFLLSVLLLVSQCHFFTFKHVPKRTNDHPDHPHNRSEELREARKDLNVLKLHVRQCRMWYKQIEEAKNSISLPQ